MKKMSALATRLARYEHSSFIFKKSPRFLFCFTAFILFYENDSAPTRCYFFVDSSVCSLAACLYFYDTRGIIPRSLYGPIE